jgi:hypothetical protein
MEYGIFTSKHLEIAQSRFWTICFYCDSDKTNIGVKLYNGTDENKTLAAICNRDIQNGRTVYAYETPEGKKYTNDFDGVCKLIGEQYNYTISGLTKIDDISISDINEMPSVSESGIKNCLKYWRMGTSYNLIHDGMQFQMVTDKVEYIFMIQNENCNIYCGASVNIPCENGMLGGNQYFRLRNYADNSQPFCRFFCNIGDKINVINFNDIVCESGKCSNTSQGLFWPVKRYSDNEIVLDGCGGDEYVYRKDNSKSEFFITHL